MTAAAKPLHSGNQLATRGVIAIVAVLIALILLWRVLATGAAALLDAGDGTKPATTQPSVEAPAALADIRQRVAQNPADYVALLALALQAERDGNRNVAIDAAAEALKLAPADPRALKQSARILLDGRNDARALAIMRQLVELHPAEAGRIWPIFTLALDSGRHGAFFTSAARENPSWWPSFFGHACSTAALPGLESVFGARVTSGEITADERRCLIGRLQRVGRWPAAYQLWMSSLPKEQQRRVGFVFNGEFEYPLSNLGFDWQIGNQDGVSVTTESTEGNGGRRALHLTFVNKRFTGPPLHQFLMLNPGRYRFDGRGRAEGLNSWLGLQWGLYCHDAAGSPARQLAQSDSFLGSSDWADFNQTFVVTRDCPVQILRLELTNPRRDAKEGGNVAIRLRGSIWFDDLRVKSLD